MEARWRRTRTPRTAARDRPPTTLRTSPCSRVSRRSASAPASTSCRPARSVCTTEYERGAPQYDLRKGEASSETGTTISFLPDGEIFESLDFDFSILEQRLRETAFLTRGLRISLTDERSGGNRVEFQYDGGIEDFVRYLNEGKEPIQKKVIFFE